MKRRLEVLAAVVVASAGISGVAIAASSPAVVTGAATGATDTSAVLHGTVNPNGSSTTYYFQWGLTNGYGVNGKALSAGGGVKPVSVHETASGLIPGTVYHYRLVATNQFGTTVGADRAFKTAGHPPPGVATGPANGVNATGATLTGAVNPAGAATTWWFQWGASPSFGQQTAAGTLAAGASAQNVGYSLQGLLAPGTIYYYRLVASHAGAAAQAGATGSFMTYPSPRPVPGVTAATRPGRARHAPFVLSTSGALARPSWMPAAYACSGNVTIRFFAGTKQVAFTLAGVQPNCTFGGQTVFARKPGGRKAHGQVRLRVVIRYVSTPYLATNRAKLEHVTLG
jgi:phosphodiesterase/alkaline phosphatase D-like protein